MPGCWQLNRLVEKSAAGTAKYRYLLKLSELHLSLLTVGEKTVIETATYYNFRAAHQRVRSLTRYATSIASIMRLTSVTTTSRKYMPDVKLVVQA